MNILKRIINFILKSFYYPKSIIKNRILFESDGPYDNSYTAFIYVVNNRPDLEPIFYCPDYVIIGKNSEKKITKYSRKNKNRLSAFICSLRLRKLIYGCHIIFSSYFLLKPINKETKFVFLGHGFGVKATKRYFDSVLSSGCDVVYPSVELKDIYLNCFKHYNNRIVISGRPRTDEIVFDENKKTFFDKMIGRKKDQKVVLAMITFRRLENGQFNYEDIFPEYINLQKLNEVLENYKILLVIKLHHVFDNSDVSSMSGFSNIVCLKNKALFDNNFTTVSVVPYPDAFLTDYSSVTSDFVLTNKQIGFLTHDIDSFNGIDQEFVVNNPKSLLPGQYINNFNDLISFFKNVVTCNDLYIDSRKQISLIYNGFTKPTLDCSKKIIDIYCPFV